NARPREHPAPAVAVQAGHQRDERPGAPHLHYAAHHQGLSERDRGMNRTTTGKAPRQAFPPRLNLRVLRVLRGGAMIHMRTVSKVILVGAFAAVAVSCGDVVRQGRAPSMLVINQLTGASGGGHAANTFSGTLY